MEYFKNQFEGESVNEKFVLFYTFLAYVWFTDYGHPEAKYHSLHSRKFNPNPKCLGTAEAYFVCHIGPNFQISLELWNMGILFHKQTFWY